MAVADNGCLSERVAISSVSRFMPLSGALTTMERSPLSPAPCPRSISALVSDHTRKVATTHMDDSEEPCARMADTAPPVTRPRKAAALVEYALILSLVSIMAVGSLALVGGQVNGVFGSVAAALGPGPHDNGCRGRAGCHENNGGGNDDGNNGGGTGNGGGNGNPGGGNPGGGNPGGGKGNRGGNGSGE